MGLIHGLQFAVAQSPRLAGAVALSRVRGFTGLLRSGDVARRPFGGDEAAPMVLCLARHARSSCSLHKAVRVAVFARSLLPHRTRR